MVDNGFNSSSDLPESSDRCAGNDEEAAAPVGRRLHRSGDRRMFLGVCGGLAEYFDADPTIVRIIFVLLAVFGGSGVLLYAAFAIIMPAHDRIEEHPREAAKATVDEAVESTREAVERATGWVREKTGRGSGRRS